MKSPESEQRGLVGSQPKQMDYNTRLGHQRATRTVWAKHRHVPHAQRSNCRERANHSSFSAKVSDQVRNIDSVCVCVCATFLWCACNSLLCCKVKKKREDAALMIWIFLENVMWKNWFLPIKINCLFLLSSYLIWINQVSFESSTHYGFGRTLRFYSASLRLVEVILLQLASLWQV